MGKKNFRLDLYKKLGGSVLRGCSAVAVILAVTAYSPQSAMGAQAMAGAVAADLGKELTPVLGKALTGMYSSLKELERS